MITTMRSKGPWALAAGMLVLALAGGAAQLAQAMPGGGHHGGGHHGSMMMSGRLLQSIGASAEQQARVHEIFKAARDEVHQQRAAAGDLRAQWVQVFTATTVDARAAEALRQKQAVLHEAASKRMLQAMIDASAVLTPEQRVKLAEQMGKRRDMMERHHRERESGGAPKRS
ncbi:periplasmic heavy metal sensor [Aquincola sp. S2]|uniref:Periplasmic heavy metal sensor n=1 Tax=Pseudaquabacterium terrae TaxID=2732868 RepID=A0ABX2END2_9BURK|nr:periplasmic heavy metal sensor [Aquabacterium terrae]NRF70133.1 periplasmic heavy metal sensor [Aquabacterium terrae]